jgi:hypothetical protein
MAVEFRDENTGAHIERIGRFSTLLAQQIGLEAELCELLSHAAPLHDIGKVAIPDAILLKPGPLTPEERSIVETHAEEGHARCAARPPRSSTWAARSPQPPREVGTAAAIPAASPARTSPGGTHVAVADVDAPHQRPRLRLAFSVEQAVEMMPSSAGRHFDPVLLTPSEVLEPPGPDARANIEANPRPAGGRPAPTPTRSSGDAETAEA